MELSKKNNQSKSNLFENLDDLIFIESKINKPTQPLVETQDNFDNFMIDLGNDQNKENLNKDVINKDISNNNIRNNNMHDSVSNNTNYNPFNITIENNKEEVKDKQNKENESKQSNLENENKEKKEKHEKSSSANHYSEKVFSSEKNKRNTVIIKNNNSLDNPHDTNSVGNGTAINIDKAASLIRNSTPIIPSSLSVKSSIESINEYKCQIEKFQKGDKTSMDLKQLVKTRILQITNDYVFTMNYSDNLLNFFRKFNSILLAKVEYSLDFHKKFLVFFKNISSCYFRFARELEKSNELISLENNQGMILTSFVSKFLEQTQTKLTSYFDNFSTILSAKMTNSGIKESKMKDYYYRLTIIAKEIDCLLTKIIKHKSNITKEFQSHSKLFEDIKQSNTDSKNMTKIFNKHDFFIIEYKLNTNFRMMNTLSKDFLLNYKEKILDLQLLVLDYINMLKDNIDTYISENKKIFNEKGFELPPEIKEKQNKILKEQLKSNPTANDSSKKENSSLTKQTKKEKEKDNYLNFDEMQKYYDSLNTESVEELFSTKKIINYEEIDVDKEYLKALNDILGDYQRNLLISSCTNVGNLEIKEFNKFKLENYSTFKQFLDFLILVNPYMTENLNDYIKYNFIVKRENGLIREKWLYSRIVITIQNNMFIFDLSSYDDNSPEIKFPKYIDKMTFETTKFIEKDSKKNPYKFILTDSKKGIVFNSKQNYEFDAENEVVYEQIKNLFEK